jgi:hypothetical protein
MSRLARILFVVLFLAPIAVSAQTSLREFDIKPVQSGRLPVFTRHPDKAAVIFNSSLTNLRFDSNLEIIEILGDAAQGEYILIVNAARQIITVSASGFQQGRIPITLNQPRQVAYFQVEPKDRVITERGNLIVRTEPAGAMLRIDGIPGEFQSPHTFEGILAISHTLYIRLDDYQSEERLVRVDAGRPNVESIRLTPNFGFLLIREAGLELFLKTPDDPQEFRVSYTPNTPLKRPIGAYSYRLVKPFYRAAIDTVTVRPGLTSEVNPIFVADFATYRFTAMPRGAVTVQAGPQNAPASGRPNEVNLQAGPHELTLNAPGYAPERIRVVARSGQVRDTTVTLTGLGNLIFSSGVSGMSVRLSTGQTATTPPQFTNLKAGRYSAVITAPFHSPDSLTVDVVPFENNTRSVTLRPLFSTLRVRTNAPAVRLSSADNRAPQSTTSGTIFLEQGQREVLVESAGYAPIRLNLRSVAGTTVDTTLTMLTSAQAGDLARREALPKGILQLAADVDADIYVNGTREGRMQTTLTLVPGRYEVEFRHAVKTERFSVDVPSADLVVRQVYLRPAKSTALTMAAVLPGSGHLYTKQKRGYGYLAAFAAGTAFAVMQNGVAADKTSEHDAAYRQYLAATTVADAALFKGQAEAARLDANRATTLMTYGIAAAAGMYVIQLADLGWTRPKYGYRSQTPAFELGLAPSGLQLTYRFP